MTESRISRPHTTKPMNPPNTAVPDLNRCLTASAFSNNGNLFCNLFAASSCQYSRLQCNPTDSAAPTFVVYGSWLFPCRSAPVADGEAAATAQCTGGHGHGVDGWHAGHGVFVANGGGSDGGHSHG